MKNIPRLWIPKDRGPLIMYRTDTGDQKFFIYLNTDYCNGWAPLSIVSCEYTAKIAAEIHGLEEIPPEKAQLYQDESKTMKAFIPYIKEAA